MALKEARSEAEVKERELQDEVHTMHMNWLESERVRVKVARERDEAKADKKEAVRVAWAWLTAVDDGFVHDEVVGDAEALLKSTRR